MALNFGFFAGRKTTKSSSRSSSKSSKGTPFKQNSLYSIAFLVLFRQVPQFSWFSSPFVNFVKLLHIHLCIEGVKQTHTSYFSAYKFLLSRKKTPSFHTNTLCSVALKEDFCLTLKIASIWKECSKIFGN